MSDYNEKYLKYKNKYLDLKYKFNIYQKGGSRFSYNDNESLILATIKSIGKDPDFMTIPERLEEYERIQRSNSSGFRGSSAAAAGGGGAFPSVGAPPRSVGAPPRSVGGYPPSGGAGALPRGFPSSGAVGSGKDRKSLKDCKYFNTPSGCILGDDCPFQHPESMGASAAAGGRPSVTDWRASAAAAGGGELAPAGGGGGGGGGGGEQAPGPRIASNWSPYEDRITNSGPTLSPILVPLIYNNLDDVTVIFPGDCNLDTIFAECLRENPKLKETLDLNNFADFNKLIKASLNRNGINSRKNIIESRSEEFRESRSNWHLRGHAQNIILGYFTNPNLYSLSIIFAEKILKKCRDKIIRMSRK